MVLDDPERGPGVLLTRRTSKLRDHPGQFALPGGSVDPGEDAVTAARRELDEELGLALGPDAVLGLLDDYPTRSGFVITPVVMAGPGAVADLVPSPDEVSELFHITLDELDVEPRYLTIEESDRGPWCRCRSSATTSTRRPAPCCCSSARSRCTGAPRASTGSSSRCSPGADGP